MPDRKDVLSALTRERLLEAAKEAGMKGLSGAKKEEIVQALAGEPRVALESVLQGLSRNELKSVCCRLGLDDSGREKAVIAARIAQAIQQDAVSLNQAAGPARGAGESHVAKRKKKTKTRVEDYRHDEAKRKNNPPAKIAAEGVVPVIPKAKYYYNPRRPPVLRFDPDGGPDKLPELIAEARRRRLTEEEAKLLADALRNHQPWLEWTEKREQHERGFFEVDPVALHIHERISAQAILKAAKRQDVQRSLFADPEQEYYEAVQFYQHDIDWTNRLILGDSLQVMSSLARREDLAGKVQMIYIDPPYGIRFGSNFQPQVGKREIKDNDADLTREAEMVKAYRDTWHLGVHSYLSYLRDRLFIARELLADTGSVFVQIGNENVHVVRCLLDDVFGTPNFVAIISVKKTSAKSGVLLQSVGDFLLWYARDIGQVKYRDIIVEREVTDELLRQYTRVETATGERRLRTGRDDDYDDLRARGGHLYQAVTLTSSHEYSKGSVEIQFEGVRYGPGRRFWTTSPEGVRRLRECGRLVAMGKTIRFVRYLDDFPCMPLSNIWIDATSGSATERVYVVQTNPKVVGRCMLMTTDPGDLVLDPTCVRKGTGVLIPLYPPVDGGKTPLSPPASGGRGTPSPLAGKVGMGSELAQVGKVAVEDLRPGDWVWGHDGRPHQVRRVIRRRYVGEMIGIRREGNPSTLWVTADHLVLANRRVQALSGRGQWDAVPKEHFARARRLRRNMSPPERILWSCLRGGRLGVKFRRQHPIGPYVADFYCRQAGLVVEVDGVTHYESQRARDRDARRDQYMEQLGLRVLRVLTTDVVKRRREVEEAIWRACQEKVLSEDPEKQWRYAGDLKEGDVVFEAAPLGSSVSEERTPLSPPVNGGRTPLSPPASGGRGDSFPACGEGRDGVSLLPRKIVSIQREHTTEEVFDIEVEGSHSFLTDVCAVHNCGSGTTAYVAEQWGRRWITIDTSRVAVAIARQRLLTAKFDYYELKDESAGIAGGFKCKTVPHITLKSIAQNTNLDPIFAKHEPILDEKLAACNAALEQVTDAVRQKLAAKLARKEREQGKRAVTDADKRRWLLPPANREGKPYTTVDNDFPGWYHWEVPFDADPDWPQELQDAVAAYREAWRAKMDEVNACIAANAPQEELVDQPEIVKGVVRVSGPFTVEAVQPPEMSLGDVEETIQMAPEFAGAPDEVGPTFAVRMVETRTEQEARNIDAYLDQMIRLLRMDGVRFPNNQQMKFTRLERLESAEPGLHAEGRWTPEGQDDDDPDGRATVCVAFGPQYGPVTAKMVEDVIRSANRMGYDDLVVAGFAFDGPSQAVIDEIENPRLRVHAAHIRPDVNPGMNGLLKEQPGSQLFTVFGQPRVRVDGPNKDGEYTVTMEGVDIYNPADNSIVSTGADKVAAWFLDSDYDGRTFCATQAFFPDRSAWDKLARALKGVVDEAAFETFSGTVSLPFPAGEHKRIAVKVIDPRGNEVMKVRRLE